MKVYLLDDNQVEDLINKSVNAALKKYAVPVTDSLPEIIKMPQAIKVLGIGRGKILKLVSIGALKLASHNGEKYKFKKADLLNLQL